MTATERVFRGDRDEVLSMDNENDYGERFFQLSFKEAIKQRIISDYKILTIDVSDDTLPGDQGEPDTEPEPTRPGRGRGTGGCGRGCPQTGFKKQGVKHAISFHPSIRAAERFREQQDVLNRRLGREPRTFTSQARRPLANAPTYCVSLLVRSGLS